MRIVAYQVDTDLLMNSRGVDCWATGNICTVLDYLLEPYGDEESVFKFAWDIDSLAIPLLQMMPRDMLQQLADTEACEINTIDAAGNPRRYRLWYPRQGGIGQALAITDKDEREEAIIWHLLNFMPEGIEPPHNVEECEDYARKVLTVFARDLGFQPTPKKLFSPVNVVRPYLDQMSLPELACLPSKVANYAAKCIMPPWVEALKLGHWDCVWDLDQVNAYPSVLTTLPDWRAGTWRQGDYRADAALGYVHCDYEIFDAVTLHPIIDETDDGARATVGMHNDRYLTKGQVDFIHKWRIGRVRIHDGVWWFPDKFHMPLQTVVGRLMRQRAGMSGDAVVGRLLAKRVMTGLWGYTARWDWRAGKEPDNLFNPPWAAEITTQVAMRNAELIYREKLVDSVISVAVDGFLCERHPTLPDGWKLSASGPALVISATQVWFGGKRPDGRLLPQVLELVQSAPKQNSWGWMFKRRATLGDCKLRRNYDLLGTTISCQSSISLKQARNRDFPTLPTNGGALLKNKYTSSPLKESGRAARNS